MVCGDIENNPDSLRLKFEEDAGGHVFSWFDVTARHQGYDGLLHGGMISTLLDAAMTHCLFLRDVEALTAELVVRFVAPACIGSKVKVSACLMKQRRGVYWLEGTICYQDQIIARADAKFIAPKGGVV
ncbi:Thioesterase superfamily protein [Vibrio quintilis]|uniref:Thioesterase superfamily protein n=2 Tax=Vibrio quintilis TaxID=1117707 RepID=A0A1M7YQR0_9VIBR|nr:Thioesterase superfamily protein [Vibrio quintilis]